MLDNLSIARFKAVFQVIDPVELPPYTGSTFRGALGHAMRRVRYSMKESCPECTIRSACRYGSLYDYLFESPRDHPFIEPAHCALPAKMQRETYPQPFILDPPAGGRWEPGAMLTLPFSLIGKAISFFPFVACALSILGSRGLGKGRGRVLLQAIKGGSRSGDGDDAAVYDAETGSIVGPCDIVDFDSVHRHVREVLADSMNIGQVTMNFVSPFRYKYEGRLGHPLTFPILMNNLLRRFTLLSVYSPIASAIDHRGLLPLAESVHTKQSDLRWYTFERYSGRQQSRMNLDGFVGRIVFAGELHPFLPYLMMGEFTNVGKDGSFGLGKYELSFARNGE